MNKKEIQEKTRENFLIQLKRPVISRTYQKLIRSLYGTILEIGGDRKSSENYLTLLNQLEEKADSDEDLVFSKWLARIAVLTLVIALGIIILSIPNNLIVLQLIQIESLLSEASKLISSINTASVFFNKLIWTIQLFMIILFLIAMFTFYLIAIWIFYKMFIFDLGFVGLTQEEKKIKERLNEENCPPDLNPKINKGRLYLLHSIKFEFIPKDVNFEEFFLGIHPTPYIEIAALALIAFYYIFNLFFPIWEFVDVPVNGMILSWLDDLLNIFAAIISVFLLTYCSLIVIKSFSKYISYKQDLKSFYYKKMSEKSHLLIQKRYKNSIDNIQLSLQLDILELIDVKTRIDKMPWLPISKIMRYYTYAALLTSIAIPILTFLF